MLRYRRCGVVDIVWENGGTFVPQENALYYIDLRPNESFELRTRELDVKNSRIRWVLDNVRLI